MDDKLKRIKMQKLFANPNNPETRAKRAAMNYGQELSKSGSPDNSIGIQR
jgi:hypothetical protein